MALPATLDPMADEVAQAALAETQFLAGQRLSIVRAPDFREDVLRTYEERLAASLDALLVRGPQIVPWLLSILPTAETSGDVCGIAAALLESRDPAAAEGLLHVLEVEEAEAKRRGLFMALRRGPIDLLVKPLQQWLATGTPRQAVAAAEVLAYHQRPAQTASRLSALCIDADPQIRRAAWRAAALASCRPAETR